MKKLILIISAVLAASGAFAAKVTSREMNSRLSRFDALLERELSKPGNEKRKHEIITQFLENSPLKGSMKSYALNKKLEADIDGVRRPLDLFQIADSINLAIRYLESISKDRSNFEKQEDYDLHLALLASMKSFRENLGLIAAKISDANSNEGRAVAKLLVMAMRIAQGTVSNITEVNSFRMIFDAMATEIQGKGMTSEAALREGISSLNKGTTMSVADINKKIEEILGCKI